MVPSDELAAVDMVLPVDVMEGEVAEEKDEEVDVEAEDDEQLAD